MRFFSFSTIVSCLLFSSIAANSSTRTRAVTPLSVVSHAQTSSIASNTVRRAILPNGLTLVTQIDRTSPRVAFSLLVRAGAGDETAQTAGWRRLLAEAMLRATQSGAATTTITSRNRQLEDLGGRLGASVGDDAIEFWATGESQNAGALLDLLLQTLRSPRLSDADVQSARQALTERRTATSDEVTTLATGALAGQLFRDAQGQPLAYGLPPLGTDASLNSLSSTRLRDLRNQFFASSRVTVGATGDLDEINLRSHLATFGIPAPSNAASSLTPDAPPLFAPRTASEPVVIPQASIVPGDWVFVSYRLAAANDADAPALSILAAALGSAPASHLSKRLLTPAKSSSSAGNAPKTPSQSPAQQASAALTPRRYGGDLTLFALTGVATAEQLRQAMRDEIRLVRETPLSAAELEAARQFATGDWALGGENLRDRAFRLASDEALGVAQANTAWTSRLQNVSAQDVQRVARKYLSNEATVIVRATN